MKSQLTQGKGRRPIIGYNNEKFRANYDAIFKKKAKRMKALDELTELSQQLGLYYKPERKCFSCGRTVTHKGGASVCWLCFI